MSWNIGNTSVRNPRRIREGLLIFAAEFNGNLDGAAKESAFVWRLAAQGIVETDRSEGEALDWHGRKWRSCFTKMGFATGKSYRQMGTSRVTLDDLRSQDLGLSGNAYELTPAGRRLIEADTEPAIADVFLRQLLRLEVTSPLEQEADSVRVKPLILLLETLRQMEERGAEGLNRTEIAAFLQTATTHDGLDARVDRILEYREARREKPGQVQKRRFDSYTIGREHGLAGLTSPQAASLVDYADTTFRYCRMSGLLSLKGNRLTIREETRLQVDEILRDEPDFLAARDPLAYLEDFYRGTRIPTDDSAVAVKEIEAFVSALTKRGISSAITSRDLVGRSPQDLALVRHRVESELLLAVEKEFAESHADDPSVIDEVLAYLRSLDGDRSSDVVIDDRPAYLEWAVWRALLALNSLAVEPHETRRFGLDSDLRPVGCAPGGGPDIIMDYAEYVAVGEVTMKCGSRQEAAEGEPVRRHVADVQVGRPGREVYCLFVAPAIDDNTAETFRIGVWWIEHRPVYLNVVPLTLGQFTRIVESVRRGRRTTADLKSMLDRCLVFRNKVGPEWLEQIASEIDSWVSKE